MTGRHLLQLTALAAIWGGSFLFMRIGAPEMGPVMLIALRTAIAGLFLLPFLYAYRAYRDVRENLPLIVLAANITMRWLKAVKPLALASLSQVFAALALTPLALLLLPDQMPSMDAWWSVILLGVVCTGAAYILYFHLIRQVGSTKTLTVTYLIPAFGLFWGWAFLQEEVTWSTIVGCLLILAGVGMTSGVFSRRPGGATSA